MDDKFQDLLDDEELTALRLQALASKKKKEEAEAASKSSSALPINSIITNESASNHIPFVQTDRNVYSNSWRKQNHSSRRRGGVFPPKSNQRSNLIVINPVAEDGGKSSAEKAPLLILPQHKWCNSGNEDSMSPKTLRRTGPTRFNRHGSDSESSDSDFENSGNDSESNETVLQDEPEHFTPLSPKDDDVSDTLEKKRRLSFQNLDNEIQSDEFEKNEATSVYKCMKKSALSQDLAKSQLDNFSASQNVGDNRHDWNSSAEEDYNSYKQYVNNSYVSKTEGFVESQNAYVPQNGEIRHENDIAVKTPDDTMLQHSGLNASNSYYSTNATFTSENHKNHQLQFARDSDLCQVVSDNGRDSVSSRETMLSGNDLRFELKRRMQDIQGKPTTQENFNDFDEGKHSSSFHDRNVYRDERSDFSNKNLYGNEENLNSMPIRNRQERGFSAEKNQDNSNNGKKSIHERLGTKRNESDLSVVRSRYDHSPNLQKSLSGIKLGEGRSERSSSRDRSRRKRSSSRERNRRERSFSSERKRWQRSSSREKSRRGRSSSSERNRRDRSSSLSRNRRNRSSSHGRRYDRSSSRGRHRQEQRSNRRERSLSQGKDKPERRSSQEKKQEHSLNNEELLLKSSIKNLNDNHHRNEPKYQSSQNAVNYEDSRAKVLDQEEKKINSPDKRRYSQAHGSSKGSRKSRSSRKFSSSDRSSSRGSSSSVSRNDRSVSAGRRAHSPSQERSWYKRSQSRERRPKHSLNQNRSRHRKSLSRERGEDNINRHHNKSSDEGSLSEDSRSEYSPIRNKKRFKRNNSHDRDEPSNTQGKTEDEGKTKAKYTQNLDEMEISDKCNSYQSKQKLCSSAKNDKSRVGHSGHDNLDKTNNFHQSESIRNFESEKKSTKPNLIVFDEQNKKTSSRSPEKVNRNSTYSQKSRSRRDISYKKRYSRSRSGSSTSCSSTSSSLSSQSTRPKLRSVQSVVNPVSTKSFDASNKDSAGDGKHFGKDSSNFNRFTNVKVGQVDGDLKASDSNKRVPVHMRLGILPRKRLIQMPKDVEAAFVNSSSSSDGENVNTKCKRQNIRIVTEVYGGKSGIDFDKKNLEKSGKRSDMSQEKAKRAKTHR